jgi:hypothetical protein
MYLKRSLFFFVLLMTNFFFESVNAQFTGVDYNRLLQIPLQYTVLRTSENMIIDGKDDEKDWYKAPWTPLFTEIASGNQIGADRKTQCKMLWDDDYLYLFARLQESDLWASLTGHDDRIFQDNAFEMFIAPDGSTFNYFEIQINAYGAVWDMFLSKPYRNGGKNLTSWDLKELKKAIQLNGTLNNPSDRDKNWNIELAIPFKSLILSGEHKPAKGTIWRMNFARVQWDLDTLNDHYFRRKDNETGKFLPEHYTVWSPQGIVNLHYPERWGYVQFSDTLLPEGFLSEKTEKLKLMLWKYYYLQQEYKKKQGKYAANPNQLDMIYTGDRVLKNPESEIKLAANDHQFWIQIFLPELNKYISVDEQGELHIEDVPQ